MGFGNPAGMWEREPRRGPGFRRAIFVLLLVLFGTPALFFHRLAQLESFHGQTAEAIGVAEPAKAAISAYYARHHAYPSDNRQAGAPEPAAINGKFVASVTIADGRIMAIYGNQADPGIAGKKLMFSPYLDHGKLQWRCDSAAGTNLDPRYLPGVCR